jgi:hypothetical protein
MNLLALSSKINKGEPEIGIEAEGNSISKTTICVVFEKVKLFIGNAFLN